MEASGERWMFKTNQSNQSSPALLCPADRPVRGYLPRPDRSSQDECLLRGDRQSYFRIVRSLVGAQFDLGDRELAGRIWRDVDQRDLDLGRIIHLLYGQLDHSDDDAMRKADDAYLRLIMPD